MPTSNRGVVWHSGCHCRTEAFPRPAPSHARVSRRARPLRRSRLRGDLSRFVAIVAHSSPKESGRHRCERHVAGPPEVVGATRLIGIYNGNGVGESLDALIPATGVLTTGLSRGCRWFG